MKNVEEIRVMHGDRVLQRIVVADYDDGRYGRSYEDCLERARADALRKMSAWHYNAPHMVPNGLRLVEA